MFVLKRTLRAVQAQLEDSQNTARFWKECANQSHNRLCEYQYEANRLAGLCEALEEQLAESKQALFTVDDLKRLINLCHPDRHQGKGMATTMTQKLVALKRQLEGK